MWKLIGVEKVQSQITFWSCSNFKMILVQVVAAQRGPRRLRVACLNVKVGSPFKYMVLPVRDISYCIWRGLRTIPET